MSKNIIIACAVSLAVLIIAGSGWLLFNRTNSATFQLNATAGPQNSVAPLPSTAGQSAGATTVQNSDKSIISFTLSGLTPEVNGVIDYDSYKVTINVPSGTDVTKLTPTISIPAAATISPKSGVAENFTNPVAYTVTAQDGSAQNYIVTVITGAGR